MLGLGLSLVPSAPSCSLPQLADIQIQLPFWWLPAQLVILDFAIHTLKSHILPVVRLVGSVPLTAQDTGVCGHHPSQSVTDTRQQLAYGPSTQCSQILDHSWQRLDIWTASCL